MECEALKWRLGREAAKAVGAVRKYTKKSTTTKTTIIGKSGTIFVGGIPPGERRDVGDAFSRWKGLKSSFV